MDDDQDRLARQDAAASFAWSVLAAILLALSLLLGCSKSASKDAEFVAFFGLVAGSASLVIAAILHVSSRWWRHGPRGTA